MTDMGGSTLECKTCGERMPDTAAARKHMTRTGHKRFTHVLPSKGG